MSVMSEQKHEWLQARCGKITASEVYHLTQYTQKGELKAEGKAYIKRLMYERITNLAANKPVTAAMQRGTDLEPQAIQSYSLMRGVSVSSFGFVDHKNISNFGATPDGVTSCGRLIEVKCPLESNVIEILEDGKPLEQYIYQIQAQMMCSGINKADFILYHPDICPSTWVYEVNECAETQEKIMEAVIRTDQEIERRLEKLKKTIEQGIPEFIKA